MPIVLSDLAVEESESSDPFSFCNLSLPPEFSILQLSSFYRSVNDCVSGVLLLSEILEMALLQRYSCCSTTTSLASTVSFSLQPQRSVLQLQRAQKWKLRFSVCRASFGKGADVALPQEETGQQFFKDESTGVVCYHDENGDVTCVGWDEGPHFQPDPQQPTLRRRRFTPRSPLQGRSDHEVVKFKNVEGRMGDSLIEVANESLECSEL